MSGFSATFKSTPQRGSRVALMATEFAKAIAEIREPTREELRAARRGELKSGNWRMKVPNSKVPAAILLEFAKNGNRLHFEINDMEAAWCGFDGPWEALEDHIRVPYAYKLFMDDEPVRAAFKVPYPKDGILKALCTGKWVRIAGKADVRIDPARLQPEISVFDDLTARIVFPFVEVRWARITRIGGWLNPLNWANRAMVKITQSRIIELRVTAESGHFIVQGVIDAFVPDLDWQE